MTDSTPMTVEEAEKRLDEEWPKWRSHQYNELEYGVAYLRHRMAQLSDPVVLADLETTINAAETVLLDRKEI